MINEDAHAANNTLLQMGLTSELHTVFHFITFRAWRQDGALKPHLQQADNRYRAF
ncbi:MAG: hypothetical protein POELPBGB_01065 [Bacteroidia bacterium]|nr:hypothetical protein [Bacteroidia bacterium]